MRSLSPVTRFELPTSILKETELALRHFGAQDMEGRVLWYGVYVTETTFRFTRCVVPRQETGWAETVVFHDEILRQSKAAVERGEDLGAQVHSHPAAAYHSAIDNEEPVIREYGGLSVVVPDYAEAPLHSLDHCATFRLTPDGWCGPMPIESLRQLIFIIDGGYR